VAAEFPGSAEKPPPLFERRRVRKAGKSRATAKRRRILLLFREKSLKHFVSIHLFSQPAQHHILRSLAVHKTGVRQDMVLGFLTRNELVDS